MSSEAIALGILHDFRCAYCGRDLVASIEALDSWQEDHLHPKSSRPDDAFENRVVSCKLCNFVKRGYVPQGATRAERIADGWRYIQSHLANKQVRWEKARDAVAAYRASNPPQEI